MKPSNRLFLASMLTIILFFVSNAIAQKSWLDNKSLENWNKAGVSIPKAPKMESEDLKRCAKNNRPATLPGDQDLTTKGWVLVGAAQVFGATTLVTATSGFDGMCRPMNFNIFVFSGKTFVGTLSPNTMYSRSDGVLKDSYLFSKTQIHAEYARYLETDAFCCPSRTNSVLFEIKGNLLTRGTVETSDNNSDQTEKPNALTNTIWRWESFADMSGKFAISKPENYQIEFKARDQLGVKADCNGGGGNYRVEGNKLKISSITTTLIGCGENSLDTRFLRELQSARNFQIEGNRLVIYVENEGWMSFLRVSR